MGVHAGPWSEWSVGVVKLTRKQERKAPLNRGLLGAFSMYRKSSAADPFGEEGFAARQGSERVKPSPPPCLLFSRPSANAVS